MEVAGSSEALEATKQDDFTLHETEVTDELQVPHLIFIVLHGCLCN
jgi:hypothetical protein